MSRPNRVSRWLDRHPNVAFVFHAAKEAGVGVLRIVCRGLVGAILAVGAMLLVIATTGIVGGQPAEDFSGYGMLAQCFAVIGFVVGLISYLLTASRKDHTKAVFRESSAREVVAQAVVAESLRTASVERLHVGVLGGHSLALRCGLNIFGPRTDLTLALAPYAADSTFQVRGDVDQITRAADSAMIAGLAETPRMTRDELIRHVWLDARNALYQVGSERLHEIERQLLRRVHMSGERFRELLVETELETSTAKDSE